MTVLDTSFIIDVLRNKKEAVSLRHTLGNEKLLIPTPAIMELWAGALRSNLSQQHKREIEELMATMTIINFDTEAAKRSGEIKHLLRQTPIDPEDMMIAGMALARGDQVVTRDEHYVRIPGLRVLKY